MDLATAALGTDSQPATQARGQQVPGWILAGSGAAIAIGSVLPWRTFTFPLSGTITINGTNLGSVVTLVLGVLLVTLGIYAAVRGMPLAGGIVAAVAAGAAAVVWYTAFEAIYEISNPLFNVDDGPAGIGIGLWIVGLGTIGAFFGAIIVTAKRAKWYNLYGRLS